MRLAGAAALKGTASPTSALCVHFKLVDVCLLRGSLLVRPVTHFHCWLHADGSPGLHSSVLPADGPLDPLPCIAAEISFPKAILQPDPGDMQREHSSLSGALLQDFYQLVSFNAQKLGAPRYRLVEVIQFILN